MTRYQLPGIQEVRAIKTVREVSYITKAQRISEQVLAAALRKVRLGVSEIRLARFIVAELKRCGVKALAFEPIVAFGKGSADIHHWATRARLQNNHTVMFDFGATYQGYCSDMTRTFFFGEPTAKFRRVYQGVLEAQERARRALERGERKAAKADAVARRFLYKKFGATCFPHGLGHGVGTAIHEWPAMTATSSDTLAPGMVLTLEPGVYLKGWGGVRIEDMVLIKSKGIRNLTHAPKNFAAAIVRP